jgi:hypothetical protein
MRFKLMLSSAATMLLAVASQAMAAPLAFIQDAPVKVDVTTTESHTSWYADPMWLAIGGLALLIVIVLAVMAGRGRDSGTTTVVR